MSQLLYEEFKNLDKGRLNTEFIMSCINGQLDRVKYLLTSPDLKKHADIHINDDMALFYACQRGDLELVKYLLTSPDLNEHADIHADNDLALLMASDNGHLNVVKYLIESPELDDHIDVHINEDASFKNASRNNHLDIIRYFIFDLHIEKTNHIKKHLYKNPNETIENMFELREINEKLQKGLSCNNEKTRKPKL